MEREFKVVVNIGVDVEDFEADSGRVRRSESRVRRDRSLENGSLVL